MDNKTDLENIAANLNGYCVTVGFEILSAQKTESGTWELEIKKIEKQEVEHESN